MESEREGSGVGEDNGLEGMGHHVVLLLAACNVITSIGTSS